MQFEPQNCLLVAYFFNILYLPDSMVNKEKYISKSDIIMYIPSLLAVVKVHWVFAYGTNQDFGESMQAVLLWLLVCI